ncbi:unnamed protein product [Knipowitschia caucasica]|uniref:B30.2/SPRY domain-containing protein n=1 Tax=Knipowitschia caucasica TaxID=637954 RepID=A0AAV2LGF3_KNICA
MDLLEAEEKQALNQAHGIQVHLENRLLDLRKTQVQVQRISRTKNSLDFLQEYCEWRQQALDTSLPSVCIELKDTSKFFAKIITESTEKLCVAMTTEFTDRLHKACTHEPALGIKTTVQKINAAQRNKRLPDPQTRKDLLKYGKQLSFDGTSSHKFLRLTEEGRKVTNTTPWQHPYPDHDLRFDHWRQVLCTESVYLDRVYYELDFNGDGTHLGLAYKSLPRKGAEAEGCLCSNNGSWCLQWTGKSFSAWHDDEEVILPVTPGPRFSRMGVYVDHTGGLLRFYGLRPSPVDDDAQICLVHEFTAQFREPLYPAFFLPKKENAVMLVPPGEPVKSPTPPTSSNNNENANNNNGNANNNNEKTTSPLNGDSKTVTSETAQNVNAKNAKSEVAEEAKANSDGNANKWNANPTENRDSNTPTKETAPNANANNSSNAKSDIADIG